MPEEENHRNALHYLTITVLQINRFVKKTLRHLVLGFFLEYKKKLQESNDFFFNLDTDAQRALCGLSPSSLGLLGLSFLYYYM